MNRIFSKKNFCFSNVVISIVNCIVLWWFCRRRRRRCLFVCVENSKNRSDGFSIFNSRPGTVVWWWWYFFLNGEKGLFQIQWKHSPDDDDDGYYDNGDNRHKYFIDFVSFRFRFFQIFFAIIQYALCVCLLCFCLIDFRFCFFVVVCNHHRFFLGGYLGVLQFFTPSFHPSIHLKHLSILFQTKQTIQINHQCWS